MASRKEERERLRRQRLAAERSATGDERRRLILGYAVAGILGTLVVAGIVVVVISSGDGGAGEGEVNEAAGIDPNTGAGNLLAELTPDEREGTPPPEVQQADLDLAAEAAGCDLRRDLADEGNTHVAPGQKLPDYSTSPPASGSHFPENVPDGAYLDKPGVGNFLHSIEHGRIELQYDPKLPEDDQLAIKGLFDADPQGMLMFPNPDMPFAVAAVTWTNLLGCDSFEGAETIDALRDFRDELRGQGPETVPF